MLAGLKIDNSTQSQTIYAHTQAITDLQVEGQKMREKVCEMKHLQGVNTDLTTLKVLLNSESHQICHVVDKINITSNSRLSVLES